MITCFQSQSRGNYSNLTGQMYALRAEVFGDRLKWKVTVRGGYEYDHLDNSADPLYVLSVCETTGALRGGFRFLPTTGPTLLKSALNVLFSNPVDIESPTIWECTRFVVCPKIPRKSTIGGICSVTAELMMAACHLGLEAGLTQIMAVFERPMLKIYRRAGWTPEILEITNEGIGIGLWDVSKDALGHMRTRNGIALLFADPNTIPQPIAA